MPVSFSIAASAGLLFVSVKYSISSSICTTDYDIFSSRLFSAGTLPLMRNSFSAIIQNKNTLLQWQTSNEQNVENFNLQRSLDGISFTSISTVNSTGNSTITKNYSYTDNTLTNLNAATIYYRLQMVVIDGKVTYTKIEVEQPAGDLFVSIAPNPIHDFITVSSNDKMKTISIINIKGQLIKYISISGASNQQKIDVRGMPAGNYFIKAVGEKQVWAKQFVQE